MLHDIPMLGTDKVACSWEREGEIRAGVCTAKLLSSRQCLWSNGSYVSLCVCGCVWGGTYAVHNVQTLKSTL